jgi:hypothetical protein
MSTTVTVSWRADREDEKRLPGIASRLTYPQPTSAVTLSTLPNRDTCRIAWWYSSDGLLSSVPEYEGEQNISRLLLVPLT